MKINLCLVAAALSLTACGSPPEFGAPSAPEVGVITIETESVTLQSELSGRTSASLSSEVRPQVGGIIKARRFQEGAEVAAGQLLYEIDRAPYQAVFDEAKAALASAEASVEAARLKHERYQDLLGIEGVSRQDADDAQSSYRQAVAAVAQQKAALETARINLGYTEVRAPIAGRIGKSSVTPGALVDASQTTALATIRALDPIYVDLTQSSAALLQLRRQVAEGGLSATSAPVTLKLEDGSTYAHQGELKFAEVAVDETTGSVTLRAEFPNPEGNLLPGMYVRAVLADAVNPQAILAPQQGVSRDPQGHAVALIVNAEGKIEQRQITADRVIGSQWLVSSGLKAGDHLVVQGSNKAQVGAAVTAVDASASLHSTSAASAASSASKN